MMALLLLCALLLPAQDASVQDTCGACENVGTLRCKQHDKKQLELEQDTLFCSVAMSCPDCMGALVVDCDRCPLGDEQIAKSRQESAAWMESMQEHWTRMGHDFPIGRSPHFELFWSGKRIVVKKKGLSDHEALHLYLDRLENLYEEFKLATGATDDDFSTIFKVMIWKRHTHNKIAAAHYTGQPNPGSGGTKRMGAVGIYTVFLDPAIVDADESATADLYRGVVHHVSHLLLANVWNARWPGELGGGWIDVGVAHYFEDKLHQRCTFFCYREQDTLQNFKGGRWSAPVKKLAKSRNLIPFAETSTKRTSNLSIDEHALSWSYCEFLISKNPEGFGAICRAIKERRPFRDELKKHFGLSPLTFQKAWKEHVLRTYKGR